MADPDDRDEVPTVDEIGRAGGFVGCGAVVVMQPQPGSDDRSGQQNEEETDG